MPSESNCAGFHPDSPFKVDIEPVDTYATYNYTDVTFHVDRGQVIIVSVWSRNSGGMLSLSPASEEVTAPQIRKNSQAFLLLYGQADLVS